jgi:hypothetical protein
VGAISEELSSRTESSVTTVMVEGDVDSDWDESKGGCKATKSSAWVEREGEIGTVGSMVGEDDGRRPRLSKRRK